MFAHIQNLGIACHLPYNPFEHLKRRRAFYGRLLKTLRDYMEHYLAAGPSLITFSPVLAVEFPFPPANLQEIVRKAKVESRGAKKGERKGLLANAIQPSIDLIDV
jgi:hypothetical protein